eukprot:TRINITY_DN2101_c0_g2_i2.p1 TRINITY_DN2101_c0_g2~~TRINITY_DN2101_c0_g2_i2.p1  ORF type:complete len:543 (+),score=320.09 TRINITY_DN2101_c0_g2_i2:90-1631(+)
MPVAVAEVAPQQQDRPRRQRQQLVPYPADAPKEPDRVKMKDSIEKLRADATRARDRLTSIKEKLSARQEDPERTAMQEEKKALIQQRKALEDRIMEKVSERNVVQTKLREARNATRDAEREVRELNRELRDYKSVEEVDAAIKRLEFRLETGGAATLKGEKRIMQEIKALQSQRAKFAVLDDKLGQIQARSRDVGGDQKELQRVIDEMREESICLREKIDETSQRISGRSDQGQMQALRAERDELNKKVSGYYAEMDKIRATFDEQKKKFEEFKAEHKKLEDAAWEKKRQEQAAERAKKEEERRLKELEIAAVKRLNPHEDEIAMCESLIAYLNAKVRSSADDERRAMAVKQFDASAAAGAKGMAVLSKGKSEDDALNFGMKKKGGKKGGAGGGGGGAAAAPAKEAAPKSRPIQHQYAKFEAFEKVGLKAPMRTDEVKECIEKLKEKVAHFRSFIKTEKEALEEEKAAQEQERIEKEAADKAAKAAGEAAAAAEAAAAGEEAPAEAEAAAAEE